MRNRRERPQDTFGSLFLDVAGELPDDASLLRMRRVSDALNLRDNDALWSMISPCLNTMRGFTRPCQTVYEGLLMAVSTWCAERIERRFVRALRRLWAMAAILLAMFVGIAVVVGEHLR